MWRKRFSALWVNADPSPGIDDLPRTVLRRGAERVRRFWRNQVWQILLGEIALWYIAQRSPIDHQHDYVIPLLLMVVTYLLSIPKGMETIWLMGMVLAFIFQGILFKGLGPLTALSLMLPYTIAALILPGTQRIFVQACCVIGFWFSLIYEIYPYKAGLSTTQLLLVGYNVLIAAFTFQGLRALNRIGLELSTAHAADEITQRSQQFLARVSHELRTPLNSVLGFAKLLRRNTMTLTEAQIGYLNQIVEEGEQLNHLVSDLLDSAQLATGKLRLTVGPCSANQICSAVADEIKSILKPGVTLTTVLQPDLPDIAADNLRLRQIVRNLVGNAAKYTPRGEITIRTAQHGGRISIAVSDTGPGIPEDQQGLVFVPFVKLDGHSAGVGLGLDIALQLARLHGGNIRLESLVGQGSTFIIDLPLQPLPVTL